MSINSEILEAYGDWPWLVSEETIDVVAAITVALDAAGQESFEGTRRYVAGVLIGASWRMQFDAALGMDGAFDVDRVHDYFQPAPATWPQGRRPGMRY